jgi:hypothetical protein
MRTTKQRTVFQSTKQVLSSATDIIVATTSTASAVVELGRDIISNNLSAMRVATLRDNHIENSVEVDESLNVCDSELDALEVLLTNKDLTPRQKARIQLRIRMWEETVAVISTTTKF